MLHKITGKLDVCVCVHACADMHIDVLRGRITVVYFDTVFLARNYIVHGLPGLNIAFEDRYKVLVHCNIRILGGNRTSCIGTLCVPPA